MQKTIFSDYTPLRPYYKDKAFNQINNRHDDFFAAIELFDADHALNVIKTRDSKFFEDLALKNYKLLEKDIGDEVSAYKSFAKGADVFTDKSNYLSKYSLLSLLPNKSRQYIKMISVSSGSSGKPYFWPRGKYLEVETTLIYELILKDFFNIDKKNTLIIDAYSMGMYVAGAFTLNACLRIALRGYNLSIITPGISLDDILRIISEIGSNYEQIIICGYPPFVKDVIEEGLARGINWKCYKLKFIFGAEAISEDWREYLYKKASIKDYYTSSINTYGSADAAILGHETPFSILIKKISNSHGRLLDKIFNGRTVSTFVQYHPHLKFFECVNSELICSTVGGLPLLRYNLHDEGKIYSFSDMVNQLKDMGVNILEEARKKGLPIWKLPFIVLFGKSDQTITLYGLNIYPQTVRKSLEHGSLISQITTRMTMSTKYDFLKNQYIQIEVELKQNKKANKKLQQTIENKIFNNLVRYNYEYKTLVEKIGHRAKPKVILRPYGAISNDRGSKQKWIR